MDVDILTLRIEQEHQIARAREAAATAIESLRVAVTIAKALNETEGFTALDETHVMAQSLGGRVVADQQTLARVMAEESAARAAGGTR